MKRNSKNYRKTALPHHYLPKSTEEDSVFAEHRDDYWIQSDVLTEELLHQTFSQEDPDPDRMHTILTGNPDYQDTIGLSGELLRIYVASGITLLTQEAIRRGIPQEKTMEIRRRAFVSLSETKNQEKWSRISEQVIYSLHDEFLRLKGAGPSAHMLVRKARNYIYLHRQTPLTASDVARHLHTDRTYLARLFREDLHTTISACILSDKMEEAAEWILEEKYPLQEIAANLGFSSYSYFSRRFRAYYGVSPREYQSDHSV